MDSNIRMNLIKMKSSLFVFVRIIFSQSILSANASQNVFRERNNMSDAGVSVFSDSSSSGGILNGASVFSDSSSSGDILNDDNHAPRDSLIERGDDIRQLSDDVWQLSSDGGCEASCGMVPRLDPDERVVRLLTSYNSIDSSIDSNNIEGVNSNSLDASSTRTHSDEVFSDGGGYNSLQEGISVPSSIRFRSASDSIDGNTHAGHLSDGVYEYNRNSHRHASEGVNPHAGMIIRGRIPPQPFPSFRDGGRPLVRRRGCASNRSPAPQHRFDIRGGRLDEPAPDADDEEVPLVRSDRIGRGLSNLDSNRIHKSSRTRGTVGIRSPLLRRPPPSLSPVHELREATTSSDESGGASQKKTSQTDGALIEISYVKQASLNLWDPPLGRTNTTGDIDRVDMVARSGSSVSRRRSADAFRTETNFAREGHQKTSSRLSRSVPKSTRGGMELVNFSAKSRQNSTTRIISEIYRNENENAGRVSQMTSSSSAAANVALAAALGGESSSSSETETPHREFLEGKEDINASPGGKACYGDAAEGSEQSPTVHSRFYGTEDISAGAVLCGITASRAPRMHDKMSEHIASPAKNKVPETVLVPRSTIEEPTRLEMSLENPAAHSAGVVLPASEVPRGSRFGGTPRIHVANGIREQIMRRHNLHTVQRPLSDKGEPYEPPSARDLAIRLEQLKLREKKPESESMSEEWDSEDQESDDCGSDILLQAGVGKIPSMERPHSPTPSASSCIGKTDVPNLSDVSNSPERCEVGLRLSHGACSSQPHGSTIPNLAPLQRVVFPHVAAPSGACPERLNVQRFRSTHLLQQRRPQAHMQNDVQPQHNNTGTIGVALGTSIGSNTNSTSPHLRPQQLHLSSAQACSSSSRAAMSDTTGPPSNGASRASSSRSTTIPHNTPSQKLTSDSLPVMMTPPSHGPSLDSLPDLPLQFLQDPKLLQESKLSVAMRGGAKSLDALPELDVKSEETTQVELSTSSKSLQDFSSKQSIRTRGIAKSLDSLPEMMSGEMTYL